MGDETPASSAKPTQTDAPADVKPTESDVTSAFPDPSEFENFDDVDSETVELPDDSYDSTSATDEEVND